MQKQNHNMRTERKSSIKNSATRLILIALLVLIQTGWIHIGINAIIGTIEICKI